MLFHFKTIFFLIMTMLGTKTVWGFTSPSFYPQNKLTTLKQKTIRNPTINENNIQNFSNDHSFTGMDIERDSLSMSIRTITGKLSSESLPFVSDINPYIEIIENFVNTHEVDLKIRWKDLKLRPEATLMDKDVQFFKFNVFRSQILIEDASVDFRFKQGSLVQVINSSFAEASIDERSSSDSLLKRVKKSFPRANIQSLNHHFRVKPTKVGYKLIKTKRFILKEGRKKTELQLDHATGEVFEHKNLHYYLQGRASIDVFPRWWKEDLVTQALPFVKINIGNQAVFTNSSGEFYLDSENNEAVWLNGLSGKFAKIKVVSGSIVKAEGLKIADAWEVYLKSEVKRANPWQDKTKAQAMAYYHTTKIVQYAKQFIASPWLEKPLLTNTNLMSHCNAHWDGQTINFYTGSEQCANTALIADVIYHEWGHGLDANTGGIQDGAFSEGFGDIVALLLTRSEQLGIGFKIPSLDPVRHLEPNKIYPQDQGEVHAEGLIIGSTFWDLFKALRRKHGEDEAIRILSNFAFKMIFTARTYLDVYQALLVIDDDDNDLSNKTPNYCLINLNFAAHGLTEKDPRCTIALIRGVRIEDDDEDGIIEPGETVSLHFTAQNSTLTSLNDLTGEMTIPEPIPGVYVSQSSLSWPAMAKGESSESNISPQLSLDSDIPCGEKIITRINLRSGSEQIDFPYLFSVGKNIGKPMSYQGKNLPLPIKDLQTTTASITIDDDNWNADTLIEHAHLNFSIKHSYRGDLKVELVSPQGKIYKIYNGSGGKPNVHYSKDITELLGENTGFGEWQLKVKDREKRDEGELQTFEMILTASNYVCQ